MRRKRLDEGAFLLRFHENVVHLSATVGQSIAADGAD
jgi:hypothetical protein